MTVDSLDEREFELINIIGAEINSNQRELSRHMDLSLGLTNMLVRRLISKGYIRISQLNKRKVKYILTPKGFAEKMRKSVKYTLKTINSIGLVRERLHEILRKLYNEGERQFLILGESDLAVLVEAAIKEAHFSDCSIFRIKEMPSTQTAGTVLVCTEKIAGNDLAGQKKIFLINELAKNNEFFMRAQG